MKRIFGLIFLILLGSVAVAHPPSDIISNYDTETHFLTVQVFHRVKKVSSHYVERIVVELNGEEILSQKFSKQSDEPSQDVQYTIIDAQIGDTIRVTGYCNISGKKTASIQVAPKE